MATGIAVSDKCLDAYQALSKREYGTVIIKLNEEHTEFVIDKCLPPTAGNPEAEWKTLIETIPKDNCRFIITDFSWKETPTVVKSKIIQIIWSPDSSPIFSKM